MYRSLSELHAYATQVFHYFAEHDDDENDAQSTGADGCLRTAKPCTRLDKCGVSCAMYVLLGYYPSTAQLTHMFELASCNVLATVLRAQNSSTDDAQCGVLHDTCVTDGAVCSPSPSCGLDQVHFIRAITSFALENKECSLAGGHDRMDDKDGVHATESSFLPTDGAKQIGAERTQPTRSRGPGAPFWTYTAWHMFSALAGGKAFITKDDFVAAANALPFDQQSFSDTYNSHDVRPFPACEAVDTPDQAHQQHHQQQHPDRFAIESSSAHTEDAHTRLSYLAHVFDLLDRDGDGRLDYTDVKSYLTV